MRRVGWRGRRGERLAKRYLKMQGYRIVGKNLRARFGEVDLLARGPDHTVAVVEVKTGTPGQELPELRVNWHKQRKLTTLCAHLARQPNLANARFRFDVVAVEIPSRGKPTIRHHPGAFESPV